MHRKYKKIFITGCPRSGTTWVYSFFKHHPEAVTADNSVVESHIYSIVLGALRHPKMSENEAWEYILAEYDDLKKNIGKKTFLNKRGNYVGPYGGLARCITRDKFCKNIRILRDRKDLTNIERGKLLINAVLDDVFYSSKNPKKRILTEKSPENIFYVQDILGENNGAKIIEVVRDGRDVCASLEERSKKEGWCPQSREKQIDFWLNYIKKGLELHSNSRFARKILRVCYEDLHKDFEREIKKIFKFAEIDDSLGAIQKIAELTDIKKLDTTDGHYRKGEIGDWEKHFSGKDIALFKNQAGISFELLGYEWE